MTSTTSAPAESGPDEPHAGPRWQRLRARSWTTRRKVWSLVVVGLVVWLVGGVVEVGLLPSHAAKAQVDLQAFRDDLKKGDAAAAAADLRAAKSQLARAQAAADFGLVRLAKFAPGVGATISDLDHLLAAAHLMTDAGGDGLKIFQSFSGDDAPLFQQQHLGSRCDQAGPGLVSGDPDIRGARARRAAPDPRPGPQGRRSRSRRSDLRSFRSSNCKATSPPFSPS